MPTKVNIVKGAEGCKSGYAVVSADTGRVLGCHVTKGEALNQLQAIYAQQAKATKK
jgi:hypothetical protein